MELPDRYKIDYSSSLGMYYLRGPAPDCSLNYYSSHGYAWSALTEAELERVTRFANMAFYEGYKSAQQDIRASLGI